MRHLVAFLALSIGIGCAVEPGPERVGRSVAPLETWVATGSMAGSRVYHSASPLPDGRVLVVGGDGEGVGVLSSTEVFDPVKGTFSGGAALATPRAQHTATVLADGRILVVGGRSTDDTATALSTAELYDPKTNTWSAAGAMTLRRVDHAAVLLSSGKVLVVGGADEANFHAQAELFDPATRTWSKAGETSSGKVFHTATRMGAKVVVAGGYDIDALSTTEIYDSATNTWSAGPNLVGPHSEHAAVALDDTRLLVVGGFSESSTIIKSVEVVDLAAGAAKATGSLEGPRANSHVLRLPGGQVLAVCGRDSGGAVGRAELYSQSAGTWSSAGPQAGKRERCAAAPLPGGRVLVVGGVGSLGYYSSAEIYAPAAVATSCTSHGECASGACVDGVCCDNACDNACSRCDTAGRIGTCTKVSGPVNHCKAGQICVDDRCTDGAGTRCSVDGLSSIDASEKATSCGAYRCRPTDGACFPTCADTSQCAPGYACDPTSGRCSTAGGGDDSGCAVGSTPQRSPSAAWAALAALTVALAALGARRR